MFLGYNTNGFAHHRLEDAISILADQGYKGVALTLDVHHLDPFAPKLDRRVKAIRRLLRKNEMACVIETGARFLLDPVWKHQPTLISPTPAERVRRLEFLKLCIDIATDLDAGCVSFWSGTPTDHPPHGVLMKRLAEGCKRLAAYAEKREMTLAFEPEPGMFIDRMSTFDELARAVDCGEVFRLTVDVGHLVCNEELPVSKYLVEHAGSLANIHIEDMRKVVHDHLLFGEGEVDFADVFAGLRQVDYRGGVYVELSRHSYDAVNTARKAREFLERFSK
jgi:sugar phosphate isomerase/epimerase